MQRLRVWSASGVVYSKSVQQLSATRCRAAAEVSKSNVVPDCVLFKSIIELIRERRRDSSRLRSTDKLNLDIRSVELLTTRDNKLVSEVNNMRVVVPCQVHFEAGARASARGSIVYPSGVC